LLTNTLAELSMRRACTWILLALTGTKAQAGGVAWKVYGFVEQADGDFGLLRRCKQRYVRNQAHPRQGKVHFSEGTRGL
jgi:hypothetical protein